MGKRAETMAPKGMKSEKEPKPKPAPEGKSTMERIKTGGNKVMSLSERVRKRSAARGYPKGW